MSLLQSLLDELTTTPNGKVDLPLTHLCGIPVQVMFLRMGLVAPFRILTRIVNAEVHEGFHEGVYESQPLSPDVDEHPMMDIQGLEQSIALLETIQFSKKLDTFYHGTLPVTYESLFTGKNYTHDFTECCVCLESTQRKLYTCKHPLCRECESKLVKPKCPLCRKRFVWIPEDESDADSSDEDQ